MVSAGSYLLGSFLLGALILSVGFSAFRVRRHLLPGWDGAPARLVEAVTGVAMLIWLCELLGLFGLLYAWTLVAEALLLAAAILAWPIGAPRPVGGGGGVEDRPPAPPPSRGMTFVAIAVVFLVFAHWGLFAKHALDNGISNFDSLWYHMPIAAGLAQSHSLTELHYTDTAYITWFYTQNSELVNAAGILLTGRDMLSIFLNFGWLALAFLAAWCIGRPYGRAPLTVVAAGILLECNTLIVRAPGSAKNDTMTIALALAALAILLNAWAARRERDLEPGWAIAACGLAAGLSVGTRVTVLPVAFGLAVAVIALAPAARRWAVAGWWLVAAFAGTGFWLLRNLVVAGNPLPQVTNLGPIPLSHPERLQEVTNEFTIAHYATDTAVWANYFGPGLHEAFGSLWPLVITAAIAGAALAIAMGRDRALRWAGVAALVGVLGYIVTPLSAAGTDGAPFNFWINVRYVLPALLCSLLLLPLTRRFDPVARQWALLAALVAVLLVTNGADALPGDSAFGFGLLLAIVAVAIPVLLLVARRLGESRGVIAAGFAGLTLLVVAIGYPLQRDYLHERFGPQSAPPGFGMNSAYAWAREVTDSRIALAGTTAAFTQYGFYGTDLSNRVLYLGEKGPHGAYHPIRDCSTFRAAVNAAHPDYVVTTPTLNFLDAARPIPTLEAGWLRDSPAAVSLESSDAATIWRIYGALDPATCV
jgi:hypothetical protein